MEYAGEVRIKISLDNTDVEVNLESIIEQLETLNPTLNDLNTAVADMAEKFVEAFSEISKNSGDLKGTLDKNIGDTQNTFQTLSNTMLSSSKNVFNELLKSILNTSTALVAKTGIDIANAAATGGLTAAMEILNDVMAKNPIGLAITGAMALTGAIIGLVSWLGRDNEEQKKLKEEAKELKEEYDNLTKSIKESKEAYEDNKEVNEISRVNAKALAAEIDTLSQKTNKSVEDQAKLATMVDQLNDSVPELGMAYDATTDSLNMNADAVNGLIDAEMNELQAQVARERAVEIMKEQAALEQQHLENQRQMKAMEESGADK